MTLGLIIFLGSWGVLEEVDKIFEDIGAFPFFELEALGGGFKGIFEIGDLEALG